MSLTALAVAVITAAPGPLALVKQADADVRKVLATDATIERLAVTAEAYIDFVELARRALGQKEWERLDRKKQDDFSATMKGLLRASYAQKALGDSKNGATFEFSREDVQGNEATVSSTLVVKAERFPVTYRLYRADAKGAWRIYDVVTDDVSLVSTYADQFRKMIATKGFDGLLASLKAKRAQLEKAPGAEAGSAGTAAK
ncbi:MAG: ABC transporter substrate-binding protein [Myxococcaceae bacterium]|nr:ABC transporter substrate-binding protein [Myxococcaceae bacterium]